MSQNKVINETINFWQAAKNNYLNIPDDLNKNFKLFLDTMNVDAYIDFKNKRVLVAIKGTNPTSLTDLFADLKIGLSDLENSSRFQNDSGWFERILQRYPPEEGFQYFMTGHSLGGAIVTELMRKYPFVKFAKTFNSAVQKQDYLPESENKIHKVYNEKDLLYNGSKMLPFIYPGKKFKNKTVVKYNNKQFKSFFDYFKPSWYKAHALESVVENKPISSNSTF